MTFFDEVPQGAQDPVFGLNAAFLADPRPKKMTLAVGIYRDDELKAQPLQSVQRAKQLVLVEDAFADYLPIDGYPPFLEGIERLVLGDVGRAYAAQGVGGTGSLRVGAEFLAQHVSKNVSISHLSWPNHSQIFERAGFHLEQHPYYDRQKGVLDFDAYCQALEKLPEKTVVILHACCHNPTGADPSLAQWEELSGLMLRRKLFPFFDCAYQGFGDGIEADVAAVRLFVKKGHEMFVAYSCSKNFGLYSQRVGALLAVTEAKQQVASQMKRIIRGMYSNPPAHGARVVAEVLGSLELKKQWEKEVDAMRRRLILMREGLVQRLIEGARSADFHFLRGKKGMFGCLNISEAQVRVLKEKFGIYMLENGRFSLTGLNHKNVDLFVRSFLTVCDL